MNLLTRTAWGWTLSAVVLAGCGSPTPTSPTASAPTPKLSQEIVPMADRDLGDTLVISLDA